MRKYRNIKFILWILVIFLFCIASVIGISILFPYSENSVGSEKDTVITEKPDKYVGDYEYVLDTIYVGKPYVSGILFDYPFQKTDTYMKNKDYIKKFGEEEAQKLVDISNDFMINFFDITYRNFHDENKEYISSKLDNGFHILYNDGTIRESKNEFLDNWYQWCIDNKISMGAEYISDKSLVFYDNHKETVRGLLLLRFFECDDPERIEAELGLPKDSFQRAMEIALILDVNFITMSKKGDRNLSLVDSIDVVDVIY